MPFFFIIFRIHFWAIIVIVVVSIYSIFFLLEHLCFPLFRIQRLFIFDVFVLWSIDTPKTNVGATVIVIIFSQYVYEIIIIQKNYNGYWLRNSPADYSLQYCLYNIRSYCRRTKEVFYTGKTTIIKNINYEIRIDSLGKVFFFLCFTRFLCNNIG